MSVLFVSVSLIFWNIDVSSANTLHIDFKQSGKRQLIATIANYAS